MIFSSPSSNFPLCSGLSYGTDMRGVSTPPNELASKPIHQDIYNPTDSMDVAVSSPGCRVLFSLYCMWSGSVHLLNLVYSRSITSLIPCVAIPHDDLVLYGKGYSSLKNQQD